MISTQKNTPLSLGNYAMRAGRYADAIARYAQVLINTPALGINISANLAIARNKYRNSRQGIEKPIVAICGHSPGGRTTTLATLYLTFADVEMIGSNFQSLHGVNESGMDRVSCPNSIPKHSFRVEKESCFFEHAIAFVVDHPYDIIHLSKLQTPNVFVGILYKLFWGTRVFADVALEDFAFVGNNSPLSIDVYLKQRGRLPELQDLRGGEWTRLAIELANEFHGVTMRDDLVKNLFDLGLFSEILERDRTLLLKEASLSANAQKLKKFSEQFLGSSSTAISRKLIDCLPMIMGEAGSAFVKLPTKNSEWPAIHREYLRSKNVNAVTSNQKSVLPKLPITALIITWDVGHNPLGRSYMLAEVLQRVVRHSLLVGFQFSRYGNAIWEPVREGTLPVITLPGGDLPQFYESLQKIAARIKPDVVIACKPRLPSVALGMMIKEKWGCPLIIDIDDHELSFFNDKSELSLNDISSMPAGSASKYVEPYSEFWTRLSQNLCKCADEIIVSNVALQKKFGGTIVPHVRDENTFDPSKFNKTEVRQRYGVPKDAKILLFFGTPRVHKGIDSLARAVNRISDPCFLLLVVGTAPDRRVTANLDEIAPGKVIYLPNQPFSTIPEILAMADVVCLPQDEGHAVSKFQLPAKAIDAVAMSVPLLVTNTPPLMQLVYDSVAKLVDVEKIPSELARLARSPREIEQWKKQVRVKFLERYSYASAASVLRDTIQRSLAQKPQNAFLSTAKLVEASRHVLGLSSALPTCHKSLGVDIVLFWKQNDTGLYGRRHDMVIKYLASRSDIRKVVVFDSPISENDLVKKQHANKVANQDRWIYVSTYEKMLGVRDSEKISYNVFIYPPGIYRNKDADTSKPHIIEGYIPYVSNVLIREGVNADKAVFWFYPKNYFAPALIEHYRPAKVVVDVVDDHRAWSNITPEELNKLTCNYREILSHADIAFANCDSVLESMSEFFSPVRLVYNGCEYPSSQAASNSIVKNKFSNRKTIIYIGNLEKKIDIPLLDKLALRFADCDILLLGSTHANPEVLNLTRHKNIRFVGVVPYSDIDIWLSHADVAIIPHLNNAMTRNMNPLKAYVYLSRGVPVVSTEIFNIDTSSGFIKIAKTHEEFLGLVKQTLNNSHLDTAKLHSYISLNSWQARFASHIDELIRLIKKSEA